MKRNDTVNCNVMYEHELYCTVLPRAQVLAQSQNEKFTNWRRAHNGEDRRGAARCGHTTDL